MAIEMVQEPEKKKRERAAPELPAAVTKAINTVCDGDPFIKKTKVIAAVRARYADHLKDRMADANEEFIDKAKDAAGIRSILNEAARK